MLHTQGTHRPDFKHRGVAHTPSHRTEDKEKKMADLAYEPNVVMNRGRTSWGAIWAGVFTFVAIWSVFGLLGQAIFASSANPNAQQPVTGMSVGMGIWAVILTIIAMYVAGRETGRLAAVPTRHDGLIHGMIMFGLSVVAVIVLTVLGGTSLSGGTGVNGTAHSPYVLTVFADLGWIGFVALFLGWLAAMAGASQGAAPTRTLTRTEEVENTRRIRPAA
jgi:hypothetical protein